MLDFIDFERIERETPISTYARARAIVVNRRSLSMLSIFNKIKGFSIMSIPDNPLDNRPDSDRSFGSWRFDRRLRTLSYTAADDPTIQYEIDLECCQTSAAMLDWIMQITNKAWATDSVIADLVRALNRIIEPQAKLCSFAGARPDLGKHLTPAQLRAQIDSYDAREAALDAMDREWTSETVAGFTIMRMTGKGSNNDTEDAR